MIIRLYLVHFEWTADLYDNNKVIEYIVSFGYNRYCLGRHCIYEMQRMWQSLYQKG